MEQTRTRPPTLGDRLDELMWERDDTCDDLARAVGVSSATAGRWAADRQVPEPGQFDDVARYLGVDVSDVRRLVLRSQMRKVQREIRDGVGPPSTLP
jgi:transcriptional regulator with XRE-family HTH domain